MKAKTDRAEYHYNLYIEHHNKFMELLKGLEPGHIDTWEAAKEHHRLQNKHHGIYRAIITKRQNRTTYKR